MAIPSTLFATSLPCLYLFPFVLFLTGFDLLLDSFQGLMRKDRPLKIRLLEFGLMVVRQAAPYVAMALIFGWLWAIALWVFQMMIFGFFMGAAFAPNHKGCSPSPGTRRRRSATRSSSSS